MEIPHIKPTIQEVAKHPYAYLLIAAVSVIWFLFYQNSDVNSSYNKSCEADNIRLRTEIREERKEKNDLYNALLVSNGIIKEIKKNTDNYVREKVGNEAAEIIKK